jgi:hypothetical protein
MLHGHKSPDFTADDPAARRLTFVMLPYPEPERWLRERSEIAHPDGRIYDLDSGVISGFGAAGL